MSSSPPTDYASFSSGFRPVPVGAVFGQPLFAETEQPESSAPFAMTAVVPPEQFPGLEAIYAEADRELDFQARWLAWLPQEEGERPLVRLHVLFQAEEPVSVELLFDAEEHGYQLLTAAYTSTVQLIHPAIIDLAGGETPQSVKVDEEAFRGRVIALTLPDSEVLVLALRAAGVHPGSTAANN